jgi:hypothetical protein
MDGDTILAEYGDKEIDWWRKDLRTFRKSLDPKLLRCIIGFTCIMTEETACGCPRKTDVKEHQPKVE